MACYVPLVLNVTVVLTPPKPEGPAKLSRNMKARRGYAFVGNLGKWVIDITFTNTLGLNLFRDCRGISGRFTTLRPPGTYVYFSSGATSFARRPLTICDWTLFQQLVKSRLTRHPFWFEPVTSPEDLNTRQQFISGSPLLLQAHQYGTDYESRKNS